MVDYDPSTRKLTFTSAEEEMIANTPEDFSECKLPLGLLGLKAGIPLANYTKHEVYVNLSDAAGAEGLVHDQQLAFISGAGKGQMLGRIAHEFGPESLIELLEETNKEGKA